MAEHSAPQAANEKHVLTITLHYPTTGLLEHEATALQAQLQEVAPTRLRKYPYGGGRPEALPDLGAVLEFIGMSAIAGLIGNEAHSAFIAVRQRITDSFRRVGKKNSNHRVCITFSFDDFDATIGPIKLDRLDKVPTFLQNLHTELHQPPLAGQPVNYIKVPVGYLGGAEQRFSSADPFRYWYVQSVGTSVSAIIFDSETHTLINPFATSNDQLLTSLIEQPATDTPATVTSIIQKDYPHWEDNRVQMHAVRVKSLSRALGIELANNGITDEAIVNDLLAVCIWAETYDANSAHIVAAEIRQRITGQAQPPKS